MSKGKRKRKQSELERVTSARSVRLYVGLLILLLGAFATTMLNSAFAGGWEITKSLSSVIIEDEEFPLTNINKFSKDIDGSWVEWVEQNDPPKPYNKYYDLEAGELSDPMDWGYPEISISTSFLYYITRLNDGTWVKDDSPQPLDRYNVTVSEDPLIVQTYYHWTVGADITIETAAEFFDKPFGVYWDYGYFYEAKVTDVDVWLKCAITPWQPAGIDGDWTVTGGWSGVMSASVFNYEFGLVDEGATENYGHTIQDLEQIGQALNMDAEPTSFSDSEGIKGVPSALSAEVGVQIGAGAKYTTDGLGHWDSIAVRNVFVEYNVRFDIVTTVIYQFNLGHQEEMETPDEDNTGYQPEITPWKNFFDNLFGFFSSPFAMILLVVIILVGGGIVCIVFRRD